MMIYADVAFLENFDSSFGLLSSLPSIGLTKVAQTFSYIAMLALPRSEDAFRSAKRKTEGEINNNCEAVPLMNINHIRIYYNLTIVKLSNSITML